MTDYQLATPNTALVRTSSTALTTTSVSRELATVTDLKALADKRFAVITRNRGGFVQESTFNKLSRAVKKVYVPFNHGPPTLFVAGLAAGVVAGLTCGSWWVFGGLLATGTALSPAHYPLAQWLERQGQRADSRARMKLIPLADIQPFIDRHDAAQGAERAALHNLLTSWFHAMNARKALSPEARVALQRIEKEADPNAAKERERLAKLRTIVLEAQAPGVMQVEHVRTLEALIAEFPEVERHELAKAVAAAVRDSGRELSYEAVHALHDLTIGQPQPSSPPEEPSALIA